MNRIGCGLMILVASAIATGEETPTPKRYTVRRDVVYSQPNGKDLVLDAYLPESAGLHPAVLVVHGGSWKSGNKSQLMGYAMRLAARGFAAFAINYRLAPENKHPAQIDDCRTALAWIVDHAKEYNVDPERIGAIGYSAGAHLVFLLGVAGDQNTPKDTRSQGPRLKAVVAGGSPCDFTVLADDDRAIAHYLGGTKRERPTAYVDASPHFYLSADDPPILFFHGTGDQLVTIRGPEAMIDNLQRKGVEASLYRIEGADHITAAMNLPALEHAVEFLERHLKADATSASAP